MATYEFVCDKCTEKVELTRPMGEFGYEEKHIECGGNLIRIFTMPHIIYRAGGFQTTDKRLEQTEDDNDY